MQVIEIEIQVALLPVELQVDLLDFITIVFPEATELNKLTKRIDSKNFERDFSNFQYFCLEIDAIKVFKSLI